MLLVNDYELPQVSASDVAGVLQCTACNANMSVAPHIRPQRLVCTAQRSDAE